MSGVKLTYTIDDAPVREFMSRLSGVNTKRMFDEIGGYMVSTINQRFIDGVDPDGLPWEELSDATMFSRIGGNKSRKKKGGTKIGAIRKLSNMSTLVDRGHLRDSITHNPSRSEVEFGSNMVYAAIHQFGGETGRASGRFEMPARPYLDINQDDESEINNIVHDFYQSVVNG